MSGSRSLYEQDLPGDLLELIDHTTRGVQRLYEKTRRKESLGVSRERRTSSASGVTGASSATYAKTLDDAGRVDSAAAVTPVIGKRRTAAGASSSSAPSVLMQTAAAVQERRPAHYGSQKDGDRLLHNNNHHQHRNRYAEKSKDESAESNGGRQWPWNSVQTLQTTGASTTNTTLSSDANYQSFSARQQPVTAGGHHFSMSSTVNTSTTAPADVSSSQTGHRWKDTFKSLLSAADAPATTVTPATPAVLSAPQVSANPPQPVLNNVPCDTSMSQESAATKRQTETQTSTLVEKNSQVLERLRCQLEEQEASHREELSHIRMEHNREITQLRQDALLARQKAENDVAARVQASFTVKQNLLQAAVDNERAQVEEARKTVVEKDRIIEQLRVEVESATSRGQSLQCELDAKKKQVTELRESLTSTRKEFAELEEEVSRRKGDLTESKRREKMMVRREQDALDLVSRLELQLREQDQRSREELRRLESEFHSTTKSYQDLLGEATEKLTALERMERKYNTLKEQRRQHKQQTEELTSKMTAVQEERQQAVMRAENLQQELEQLRLQLARKEHEMREERAGHHKIVEGITQQLQEEGAKANRGTESLQKALHEAEDRTTRLEREVESLKEQLKEEQTHSERLLVQLEESALRHKEDIASARRTASAHQQQTEGVLASLKRQLREKDAKLEALATTASEPVQRLRSQLEDERSKRANLEEQFNRYKQRAKVAKEAALREVRREQQRMSSVPRSKSRSPAMQPATLSPRHEAVKEMPVDESETLPVSATTTPKGQRLPKPVLPLPPRSVERSRERNTMTPPQSRVTQAAWGSVGSISNISRSSSLCSSQSDDVMRSLDPPAVDIEEEERRDATQGTALTAAAQSPRLDNVDDRIMQHEQVLREFHQSAAEVFRKITGNRDDFLAKCTSVVRSVSHHGGDQERSATSTALDAFLH